MEVDHFGQVYSLPLHENKADEYTSTITTKDNSKIGCLRTYSKHVFKKSVVRECKPLKPLN